MLSIITICLNRLEDLKATIQSVQEQKHSVEHIIIDGNSTDGTRPYLKEAHPRELWLSEPDDGISDAFNKGISKASGQWLGFLNAGDTFSSSESTERIVNLINNAETSGATMVFAKANYGEGVIPLKTVSNHTRLNRRAIVCHQAAWIHREVFKRIGIYENDYKIRMDYAHMLKAMRTEKIFMTDEILTSYQPGGISAQDAEKFYREEVKALKAYHPSPALPILESTLRYIARKLFRGT